MTLIRKNVYYKHLHFQYPRETLRLAMFFNPGFYIFLQYNTVCNILLNSISYVISVPFIRCFYDR